MQIGNLNNVNFGALIYTGVAPEFYTKEQQNAFRVIKKELPNSLINKLDVNNDADVYAKFKSNGDIVMSVARRKAFPNGTIDRYIPFSADGRAKLIAEFDTKEDMPLFMIKKKASVFADKCRRYMQKPFCAKNAEVEIAWENEANKQAIALYSMSK